MLKSIHSTLVAGSFLFASLLTQIAVANDSTIDDILNGTNTPEGVVFEVVSGNPDYLTIALEKYQQYQQQLRDKFPDIKLAIVTHGSEQFALTTDNKANYAETHAFVQRISDETPVHICATHASWRDVAEEDFPEYVSVAPSSSTQIQYYTDLGYLLVNL